MLEIQTKARIMCTLIVEMLMKILWVMPIRKNQIMFISYSGDYSDSPKYIYRELVRQKSNFDYVWAVNKGSERENEIKQCNKVRFGSFSYLLAIARSKVVILNNAFSTYIPKRSGQIVINTWHGGSPLKTVGMVDGNITEYERFFFKEHAKKYSYYSSSSDFMTKEVFRKSFGYQGEIFNCGLPRNAVLYRDHSTAIGNVSKYFGIPIDDNHGVILYAPTHRGDALNAGFISMEQQFNIENCIKEMERKFQKKFSFLFRSHYFDSDIPQNCIIATDYPDMQELLAAADVLITDYSSCMGDMCLMYKPVFLYVPDLDEYIKDRGFYWDIYSLPFPVGKEENEFLNIVRDFDQKQYQRDVDEYLKKLGSFEEADTDKKFVEFLLQILRRNELNERKSSE